MSHGSSAPAPPLRLSPGLGDLLPVQDAGRSVVEHGQEGQAELLILALAVPVAVPPSLLCLFGGPDPVGNEPFTSDVRI